MRGTWIIGIILGVFLMGLSQCAPTRQSRASGSMSASAHLDRLVDGHDWWVPARVEPTPGTGLSWIYGRWTWLDKWHQQYPLADTSGVYYGQYIVFDWAEVNPQPGVYDFSVIDEQIAAIAESGVPGLGYVFWPRVYARSVQEGSKLHGRGSFHGAPMVPRWLEDFARIDRMPAWLAGTQEVRFLPQEGTVHFWDSTSAYLPALQQFVDTLGARYKDRPDLAWVECRYIGPRYGEGCWRAGREEFRRAEREFGLSPEATRRFMMAYIDLWADAFQGRESAVAMSNWEPNFSNFPAEYAPVAKAVWQYGMAQGFGSRDGHIEVWNRYISRGYGITVDAEGYLDLDEGFPPFRDGRIWFSENEEYCYPGQRESSSDRLEAYRWFASTLRLLQMRRNWVWINKQAVFTWPAITRYMQLSLGKTAVTSPDGWCWLREGYKYFNPDKFPERADPEQTIKNFERWVYQRDVGPDGRTQPAARVNISELNQYASARDYEYQARRTATADDQDAMYFRVARDWFSDEAHAVQVFVTYWDGAASGWRLAYTGRQGQTQTPLVYTTGSGQWKTAVFTLPDFRRAGAFAQEMDFCLRVEYGGDVAVQLVRVVKV